ncbi:hypothetical protein [Neorhizobium sp. NCHU2750]|uniref:hypothetical protein n=1 Tax=Neorhizobium sp. NCHU2750 TaxID=1825976 RepID=UPI000EB78A4E|nr:hypothetical protein NCHU2750_26630 [Neorhizobium sp. NCHU2750]
MPDGDSFIGKAILAALGIALAALVTWITNTFVKSKQEQADRTRMTSVLLGELMNIHNHYYYSRAEIPQFAKSADDVLQLKFSKYGPMAFVGKDLAQLGFLSNDDITQIMQINLIIRNTDTAIDALIEMSTHNDGVDTSKLWDRMGYVIETTQSVVARIFHANKNIRYLIPDEFIK